MSTYILLRHILNCHQLKIIRCCSYLFLKREPNIINTWFKEKEEEVEKKGQQVEKEMEVKERASERAEKCCKREARREGIGWLVVQL